MSLANERAPLWKATQFCYQSLRAQRGEWPDWAQSVSSTRLGSGCSARSIVKGQLAATLLSKSAWPTNCRSGRIPAPSTRPLRRISRRQIPPAHLPWLFKALCGQFQHPATISSIDCIERSHQPFIPALGMLIRHKQGKLLGRILSKAIPALWYPYDHRQSQGTITFGN